MRTQDTRRTGKRWLAGLALMAGVGVLAAAGATPSPEPASETAAPVAADAQELPGFAFYRQNVEPMFVRPRGYPNSGEQAACVMCHVWQTSIRLALQEMTETANGWEWTEAQSRINYQVVTQLVNASDPASSKLLRKPLSAGAGGEGHTGGTYWDSTDDPEYEVVREWIGMLPAAQFTPAPQPELDFEFYRACVQRVFANPREGQLACTRCHAGGAAGFAPAPANGTSWTDAEARRGFQAIQRLIVPGNPEQSRWMIKPLHPQAGGSYTHNGVRRWESRADPEWQMLAEWVRGERTGSNCSA
ncbi:MAG TPA: hypothetical protein VLA09_12015 [Longimicrobiales bacterium]|nr:hypothetical protein [Longimicrobiales bacterium]